MWQDRLRYSMSSELSDHGQKGELAWRPTDTSFRDMRICALQGLFVACARCGKAPIPPPGSLVGGVLCRTGLAAPKYTVVREAVVAACQVGFGHAHGSGVGRRVGDT